MFDAEVVGSGDALGTLVETGVLVDGFGVSLGTAVDVGTLVSTGVTDGTAVLVDTTSVAVGGAGILQPLS